MKDNVLSNPYCDGYFGSHPLIEKIQSLCIKRNKPFEEVFRKNILFESLHFENNKIAESIFLEWGKKRVEYFSEVHGMELILLNSNRAGNGGEFHCNPELVKKAVQTRQENDKSETNRKYYRSKGHIRGKVNSRKMGLIYVEPKGTDDFRVYPTQSAAANWFDHRFGLVKSNNGSSKSNYYISRIVNGKRITNKKYEPYTIIKVDGNEYEFIDNIVW